METYWAQISTKFVAEKIIEKKSSDKQADWEADGYCLLEIKAQFNLALKRDYVKSIKDDRTTYTLKEVTA